jgi:hypothetical protein
VEWECKFWIRSEPEDRDRQLGDFTEL